MIVTPAEALARAERELCPDRLYTLAEVAAVMGVHPTTVDRALKRVAGLTEGKGRRYGSQVLAWAARRAAEIVPGTGVLAKSPSGNKKLGGAAVTIVARQSCPATCKFRGAGCYAEHDNNRVWWDRLTAGAIDASPLKLALAEADAIDTLPGDRDLRLHVAGDSVTPEGTAMIAAACARYVERGRERGLSVVAWAYTHGWRTVPRERWGRVSVLASCETERDVREARVRGYAAALTVERFASAKTYALGAERVLPCPQQTRERTCTACRLCFDDARLREAKLAIGFSLHGGGINKAKAALSRRVALPMAA